MYKGRDVLGLSPTGSGKTASYTVPLLTVMIEAKDFEKRLSVNPAKPLAVIILPTRELASQVSDDFIKLSKGTNARVVTVFGGDNRNRQKNQLLKGCDLLVATPGRLKDFIDDDLVLLNKCDYFVLDEADRMIDMGLGPAVREIIELGLLPAKTERQTLFFSATFPKEVKEFAKEFLHNDYVQVSIGQVGTANTDIKQKLVRVTHSEKFEKLKEILNEELQNALSEDGKWKKRVLVFVEQKWHAKKISTGLKNAQFLVGTINGDRKQRDREAALDQFITKDCPVLVATSVAARGLDIEGIDLVINYHLPRGIDGKGQRHLSEDQRIAYYVQRIGRTGRLGNQGRAISFYEPDSFDSDIRKGLLKVLKSAHQEVPDWFLREVGELSFIDEEH